MSTKRSLLGNRGRRRRAVTSLGASLAASLAASVAASFTVGCGVAGENEPIELSGPPPMVFVADAHDEFGPRGGRLIELGHDHEFHAELLVEKLEGEYYRVRLIALDRSLERVRLAVERVAICTYANGVAQIFELAAISDGEYSSSDPALGAVLHAGRAVSCKIRLTIAKKPYSGVFAYEYRKASDVASEAPPASGGGARTSQRASGRAAL
jgi:hypothetical protein